MSYILESTTVDELVDKCKFQVFKINKSDTDVLKYILKRHSNLLAGILESKDNIPSKHDLMIIEITTKRKSFVAAADKILSIYKTRKE